MTQSAFKRTVHFGRCAAAIGSVKRDWPMTIIMLGLRVNTLFYYIEFAHALLYSTHISESVGDY